MISSLQHTLGSNLLLAWLGCTTSVVAQSGAAPAVVSLKPANDADGVDPAKITELVLVFDRDMNTRGFSFCGGGPQYPSPPEGKRAFWRDKRTCVLPVALHHDKTYRLAINCPAAQNFRSKEGVALRPVSWSFSTRPETLRDPAVQRKRNQEALAALRATLARSYSYYDRRVDDWDELFAHHQESILAATTDRSFAERIAKMLEVTEDLHLSVRHGDNTFAAARRSVPSRFDLAAVRRLLGEERELRQVARNVIAITIDPKTAYLAIGTWMPGLDVEAIQRELASIADSSEQLILDVRPNSGGDERLAQSIAAWFIKGTKTYAASRYRTKAGKKGFSRPKLRRIKGNPRRMRFDGKVVLLTSRYVMSSNEAFVLMMKQASKCTSVGERTFGSSGNPKPHELPNGVRVFLPSWQALRPDGSCFEGEGIAPDLEVKVPDGVDGKDPILERALELLRTGR